MAVVTMKQLLEAGVHFGHRTRRWNPKMKPYIFTERNGIHILDLQQTIKQVTKAYNLVRDTVRDGGTILFVGTKKQAQQTIKENAERVGMPYVVTRWLGGTLTNFQTIRQRVDYLIELERMRDAGEFDRLPKKEALKLNRLIEKLQYRVGGLRNMRELPNLVFIVDVRREELAVKEANRLGIPVIAMVDSNCDPDLIDLVIPANDDAIRAIKLIVGKMTEAVEEGQRMREAILAEEAAAEEALAAAEAAAEEEEVVLYSEEDYEKFEEVEESAGPAIEFTDEPEPYAEFEEEFEEEEEEE